MKELVRKTCERWQMTAPGETVLVALSGGCDSVALLLCLQELRDALWIRLAAAHVNHGIRGAEADRDQAFAEELCRRLDIPLAVFREDVPALAKARHESLEEAARRCRYRCLAEAAERFGAAAVATAHHRDDQSETVLMNLLRGSGLRGLAGIRPVSALGGPEKRLRLIRPLLERTRGELRDYVLARGFSWCEDSSNGDLALSRNRIRHELLPEAERIFPGASAHLAASAARLLELEMYLEEQARQAYRDCLTEAGALRLAGFAAQPPLIRQQLLRLWLEERGGLRDLGEPHYRELTALPERQSGTRVSLPGGRTVLRQQRELVLTEEKPLPSPEELAERFRMRRFPWEKSGKIPEKQYTKWLDCDKIDGIVAFRFRQEGDYLILADGSRKSLARFMVDSKIPLEERDRIPLAAAGAHVLWVVGYRLDDSVKLSENTRQVLEIDYGG